MNQAQVQAEVTDAPDLAAFEARELLAPRNYDLLKRERGFPLGAEGTRAPGGNHCATHCCARNSYFQHGAIRCNNLLDKFDNQTWRCKCDELRD